MTILKLFSSNVNNRGAFNSLRLMVIVLFILQFPLIIFAQETPDKEKRKEAREVFAQKYNYKWDLRWNDVTGTPSAILGYKITKYKGKPEAIAKAFLDEEKDMLGIKNVDIDLKLVKKNYSNKGGNRFRYAQKYNGVPVIASGYLVSVDNNGAIYYVSGDCFPDVKLDVSPALSSREAEQIVRSDLASFTIQDLSEPLLAIKVDLDDFTNQYKLVYKILVNTEHPVDMLEYLINANNGNIISKQSQLDKVNGNGKVYQTNPNHGGSVSKTIHRLRDLSPRKLDGDNVIVYNNDTSEASSSTATFNYSTTNTHFDEVMAYYHSDEFESWLVGKGLGMSSVGKVTIHTHYYNANPYYNYYAAANSSSRIIYFSDGDDSDGWTGLRNPTKETSVICHEYMHVVSETYNSLTQNSEAEAMDESYSDYFGLAYKNQYITSSIIGEYIDEPGGYNYKRDLINSWTYDDFGEIDLEPNYVYEEHDNSVIFSGALWDFRRDNDVNSSIADELIIESLNNLDNNPLFLDGRDALIAAANASGYSSYVDDIKDAFNAHGIYDPLSVSISGPMVLKSYQSGTWTANVTGGSGSISYQWRYKIDGGSWSGIVSTNQTYSRTMYDESFSLECKVTRGSDIDTDSYWVLHSDDGGFFGANDQNEVQILPEKYALKNAYPNPFNPETTIGYDLPEQSLVSLEVYDINGRLVKELVNKAKPAGIYFINFNAGNLSSGIYIYRISAQSLESDKHYNKVKRMLLVK